MRKIQRSHVPRPLTTNELKKIKKDIHIEPQLHRPVTVAQYKLCTGTGLTRGTLTLLAQPLSSLAFAFFFIHPSRLILSHLGGKGDAMDLLRY